MAQELFNQTLKGSYAASDRVAVSVPAAAGADNMLMSVFEKQVVEHNKIFGTFEDGDLAAGVYTINHGESTNFVACLTLKNPAGAEESLTGIFKKVDADNVAFDFGAAATIDAGDWEYILEYVIP